MRRGGDAEEHQFNTRLPNWLIKLIRADTRPNKEVAKSAFTKEFGGKRKSALEAQKEQKENRLEAVEREIEVLEGEAETLRSEIAGIEDDIANMTSPEEKYREECIALLDKLESDEHPEIQRLRPVLCESIANEFGKEPEQVWQDCKRIAAEQDRDLLNTDFMSKQEAEDLYVSDEMPIADAYEGGGEE